MTTVNKVVMKRGTAVLGASHSRGVSGAGATTMCSCSGQQQAQSSVASLAFGERKVKGSVVATASATTQRALVVRRRNLRCKAEANGAEEPATPEAPAAPAPSEPAASEAKESATPSALGGTPVKKTSMLVVGATGTLGRQVVRKALDDGYEVRCLVRARERPADFLRDWGAIVVNGDLTKPESLPSALVGVHTVVDCATGRPEESVKEVDWEGKVALIQCCQAMKIQKYVFYSIYKCDEHPNVPLMSIKHSTEKFLEESGIDFTIIRLCGFMQALINAYAVPILEEKTVFGTDDQTKIAYMDTQDIAKLTLAALQKEESSRKTLTFAGPQAFTVQQVIGLCERYAGADAKVSKVPVWQLTATKALTSFFQWTVDVNDRMAFAEVLSSNQTFTVPMQDTYQELGVDPTQTTTLEQYLQEYHTMVLKKLKEVGASSRQGDYYL